MSIDDIHDDIHQTACCQFSVNNISDILSSCAKNALLKVHGDALLFEVLKNIYHIRRCHAMVDILACQLRFDSLSLGCKCKCMIEEMNLT